MTDLTTEQKQLIIQVIVGVSIVISIILGIINQEFTTQQLAIYIGFLVGCFVKVMIPFIRKLYEGKITEFSFKFVWMIVISFFWNIPLTFPVLEQMDFVGFSTSYVLIIAFAVGLGSQWLTEEVIRLAKNRTDRFGILGTILVLVDDIPSSDESIPSEEPSSEDTESSESGPYTDVGNPKIYDRSTSTVIVPETAPTIDSDPPSPVPGIEKDEPEESGINSMSELYHM